MPRGFRCAKNLAFVEIGGMLVDGVHRAGNQWSPYQIMKSKKGARPRVQRFVLEPCRKGCRSAPLTIHPSSFYPGFRLGLRPRLHPGLRVLDHSVVTLIAPGAMSPYTRGSAWWPGYSFLCRAMCLSGSKVKFQLSAYCWMGPRPTVARMLSILWGSAISEKKYSLVSLSRLTWLPYI
ncbi:hypothetical protein SAMN05444359_111125 [Neolewinella agarilytica]|uniref:Uncharacterized protein n=1 Tax=Neolewinella agarilytica TaxID=478744 RepID=A0A1H9GVT2_9BACT|nr:hypothetical protein SAMN05444359_111125 [Neolewinella agarilytica]